MPPLVLRFFALISYCSSFARPLRLPLALTCDDLTCCLWRAAALSARVGVSLAVFVCVTGKGREGKVDGRLRVKETSQVMTMTDVRTCEAAAAGR